jgi:hypothetical protein
VDILRVCLRSNGYRRTWFRVASSPLHPSATESVLEPPELVISRSP